VAGKAKLGYITKDEQGEKGSRPQASAQEKEAGGEKKG